VEHQPISIPRIRGDLAGQVLGPEDPAYDLARAVFFPMFDRRPAVIVRPRDHDEVAYVVSLARTTGLELAVRSGGHSYAGHGTSDGGIVLDLSLLRFLEVDPEGGSAWAETGLRAGEVTTAAATHGLGISFGDTASVGIGGLTLGGGVGYLVRKHGLTIDALRAAELVTADGRVVQTDAEHHPDLFWAIRGGGGNFGVATRFQYRLHPVDKVTGGMLILPATPEAIASFIAAADAAPDEVSTIANVMPAPPLPFIAAEHYGEPVIVATIVYAGSPGEAKRAMEPFRGLAKPIADLIRELSYPEMYPQQDDEHRARIAARTMFVDTIDEDVADVILDRLERSTAPMPVAQLRVLGGALARVPAEATAFAHRKSRIMINVAASYANPAEAGVHESWVTDFADALCQGEPRVYVNFLGIEDEGGVRAAYPSPTWERLSAIKRRYDPTNLFRLNHNIIPT
jgi:FAD/FMN-containing dehydrogenase